MRRKIFYFLFFLALMPALLQAGTKGRIQGTVVDLQTGEPLIGANVIVMGTSTGAATDVNGEFLLLNLEAGTYDVRASYLGYQTVTITGVRVNADLTTYVDFELPSEDVQVGTVEIVAQKPLIQKDNTNAVRITSSEDIEALPVRGVNNIIGLTAGVVIKDNIIHIRGGRKDEVGYYLEGVQINNPIVGGRAVTISQDAVEEIQVQAGGYTAEFGGANAGIIRQQLKSGGSNLKASFEYITDNVTFKSKDDAFDGQKRLGAYWWGYNEMSAVLSGPLFTEKVKFFGNVNYIYNRDAYPQPNPGVNLGEIPGGTGDTINFTYPAGPMQHQANQATTYTGTLNFDFKPILVRLTGTFTDGKNDFGARRFDGQGGLLALTNPRGGETLYNNGSFSVKLTHVLSNSMYYELNAGYYFQSTESQDPYLKDNYFAYGDSVANANVGWVWQRDQNDIDNNYVGRFQAPTNLNILGFNFDPYGDPQLNYAKLNRNSLTLSGALSFLIGKTHSIKLGGEYQKYTIRSWGTSTAQTSMAKKVAPASQGGDGLSQDNTLRLAGVNNYGYDVFGNEVDDGLFKPREPVFASAYIQDRIEFNDLILNVGLRYDYIDTDNPLMVDPSQPEKSLEFNNPVIKEEGWVNAPTFSAVSPRIGFSFPVTDRTVFHAQWGKFVQQPRLGDSYEGYYRTWYVLTTGYFFSQPVGRNIRPTRTTQYELGFTQQLTDFMSFDITGYYRDIKDQVVFNLQTVQAGSPFSDYNSLGNGDYATTKGIEFALNMRRYERLAANLSLSFQDARGTGSFPNSNAGIVGAPLDGVTRFVPQYVTPLSYNESLTGNVNLDYRFGPNDGPGVLHDFGVSVLAKFSSGHPYTRGVGSSSNYEFDSRFRTPIEPLNASTTPSTFQVDLRVDKTVHLFDKLSANIYVYVINLFDALNQENVFSKTGSAEDDGYISQPEINQQLAATYGDDYLDVYQAINIDYQSGFGGAGSVDPNALGLIYGPPRQIRLGIRFEY